MLENLNSSGRTTEDEQRRLQEEAIRETFEDQDNILYISEVFKFYRMLESLSASDRSKCKCSVPPLKTNELLQ